MPKPLQSRVKFAVELSGWGDRVALATEAGERITYAELGALADLFAKRLPAQVQVMAVEAANTPESIVAYLAALRRGIPVLMFAAGPASRAILDALRPEAVYARTEDQSGWTLTLPAAPPGPKPHPDLAVLLSTSGSTGSPKLVRLSATNVQANAESIAEYLAITPSQQAITSLPLSYSYGLSVLNSHLAAGATILLSELSVSDPGFLELIERCGVTSLAGVPYSYELLDRAGGLSKLPSTLKTLTQAGGRMAPALIDRVAAAASRIGARFFVMYGQTEATARIAYLPPEMLGEFTGAIGKAIPGGELWVEREDGKRALAGDEGELVYRGPNVMMGYALDREQLAAPAGPDVLHTGDLAREVTPGVFRITGRLSRFVKPFGLRVGLDDLESRCRAGGAEAFAAGDDELVVIAVLSEAQKEAARAALAPLDLPGDLFEFIVVPAPPTLPSGKIDYPALLAQGRSRRRARAPADGLPAIEQFLQRMTGGRALAPDDSFERLGGDSLSYVQFSLILERALGVVPTKWESLTVEELRRLAPVERPRKRSGRGVMVESDIVLRCLAILLVLCQHAISASLQGGADVLMMLAGFSWARFQQARLVEGKSWRVFRDFAVRYLLLYVAIMVFAFALYRTVMWPHLLFYSTFIHDWGKSLNYYWFMETLAWVAAFTCLLFAAPQVRAYVRARPSGSALAFVALALAIRTVGMSLLDPAANAYRTPDQMLVYFAAGWAVFRSARSTRLGIFVVLCTVSGFAWGWRDSHVATMAIAAVPLVFLPRLWLPRPLDRIVTLIAAASFYIYLLNIFPHTVIDKLLHAVRGPYWPVEIGGSIALGVAGYLVASRIQAFAASRRRPKAVPA